MSSTPPTDPTSSTEHACDRDTLSTQRKLRIALANPYRWPYVRRGSERVLHDLSTYLSECDHEITVIASVPARAETDTANDGMHHVYFQQRLINGGLGRYLNSAHVFSWQCLRELRHRTFDTMHCLSYYDGFAAARRKAATGQPFVYQVVGIPTRRYFRAVPLDRIMFHQTLKRADKVLACSRHAADCLASEFGRVAEVLPPPIDTGHFRPQPREPGPPKILMVGCVDEPRKGAKLLLQAFFRVKQTVPDAILQFSGQASERTVREVTALIPEHLRRSVEILGVGKLEDLPGVYSNASLTVLPSVWEAFGMVLVESLACGTPVVGTNHGGIPGIITDPAIGACFEPGSTAREADNVDGLTQALLNVLELSRDSSTADNCRHHAEQFSWKTLGPRYEQAHFDIVKT
ncbi:MAG: glycosyltransferase family 4 protein [Phycisphaerales bacterium]|nr:MAG: glycosyltransferase family 4 protein [Phycisphaerales bacterium]